MAVVGGCVAPATGGGHSEVHSTIDSGPGSTCDPASGDLQVSVFVFDPDAPSPCYVWQEVTVPGAYWCEYSESIASVSGCAFADILVPYETDDGSCWLIPGDCVSDPTLTPDGAGCSAAPECTEGRPDF